MLIKRLLHYLRQAMEDGARIARELEHAAGVDGLALGTGLAAVRNGICRSKRLIGRSEFAILSF